MKVTVGCSPTSSVRSRLSTSMPFSKRRIRPVPSSELSSSARSSSSAPSCSRARLGRSATTRTSGRASPATGDRVDHHPRHRRLPRGGDHLPLRLDPVRHQHHPLRCGRRKQRGSKRNPGTEVRVGGVTVEPLTRLLGPIQRPRTAGNADVPHGDTGRQRRRETMSGVDYAPWCPRLPRWAIHPARRSPPAPARRAPTPATPAPAARAPPRAAVRTAADSPDPATSAAWSGRATTPTPPRREESKAG